MERPEVGFVEVSCADCAESRVVAFCCKGRGWCPSCTTRRGGPPAVDTEPAHVGPEVRLVKAVWRWQRGAARRHGAKGALTGAGVCFWQWFGSQIQLTPHLHLLVRVLANMALAGREDLRA